MALTVVEHLGPLSLLGSNSYMSIYKATKSIHGKEWIPYYYIVGWAAHNRWYVGCRYVNSKQFTAHPDELMVTYFTSSTRHVHPFIKQNGLPDIKWTYPVKTVEEAIYHELRIMNEFNNFLIDDQWLNKNVGGAIICDDITRAKLSAAGFRRFHSQESKDKIREARKGTTQSQETKNKISASNTGRVLSQETRDKMSSTRKGKPLSQDHKDKLSLSAKNISQETKDKRSSARKGKKLHPLSEEHKAKISSSLTGIKRKPFTEEHKAKLRAAKIKRP